MLFYVCGHTGGIHVRGKTKTQDLIVNGPALVVELGCFCPPQGGHRALAHRATGHRGPFDGSQLVHRGLRVRNRLFEGECLLMDGVDARTATLSDHHPTHQIAPQSIPALAMAINSTGIALPAPPNPLHHIPTGSQNTRHMPNTHGTNQENKMAYPAQRFGQYFGAAHRLELLGRSSSARTFHDQPFFFFEQP